MAEPRTARDLMSRNLESREPYRPPGTLPEPNPIDGYVFRWIATHVQGQHDPANASKRFRDGWVPVRAADHPELQLPGDASGNVELGGLLLCKMPIERARARDKYYEEQTRAQLESVDNHYLREQDARMPLFADRKSTTTRGGSFGSGK